VHGYLFMVITQFFLVVDSLPVAYIHLAEEGAIHPAIAGQADRYSA
jgi:hypothetical protein